MFCDGCQGWKHKVRLIKTFSFFVLGLIVLQVLFISSAVILKSKAKHLSPSGFLCHWSLLGFNLLPEGCHVLRILLCLFSCKKTAVSMQPLCRPNYMVCRKVHFYGDAPKLSVGRGGSRCWAAGAGSQHVPLSKNLSILFLPINPGSDEDITKK